MRIHACIVSKTRNLLHTPTARTLAVVPLIALLAGMSARPTWAADDNLGFRWKSESVPAGYNVTLFAPKNEDRFVGTTPYIPIRLETDWMTMDPVEIRFMPATDPDPASPFPLDRFLMTMKIVNKTQVKWTGFKFTIRDDNGTAIVNVQAGTGGNNIHPDKAHIHNLLKVGDIKFTDHDLFYENINAAGTHLMKHEGLEQDPSYSILLKDGFMIKPGDTWEPMKFVGAMDNEGQPIPDTADPNLSSLLDLHDKIKDVEGGTKFTLILQAIPEPGSLVLLGGGGIALLHRRRR